MKTKKTIVNFILLASFAIALTACGSSNGVAKGRTPPPSTAAGVAASPLQGYWQGACNAEYINSMVSYEFDGATFKQYQDQYSSNDCSDDYPISTQEVDGSFIVQSQSGESYIQMSPNNGQAASVQQYFLSGNTLQFGSSSQGITTIAAGSYTLYTGN
jgi:hypothetical protein